MSHATAQQPSSGLHIVSFVSRKLQFSSPGSSVIILKPLAKHMCLHASGGKLRKHGTAFSHVYSASKGGCTSSPCSDARFGSLTSIGRQANKQTYVHASRDKPMRVNTTRHTHMPSNTAVPLFFAPFTGRNRTHEPLCALHRMGNAMRRLFVRWYATICMYSSLSAALQQTSLCRISQHTKGIEECSCAAAKQSFTLLPPFRHLLCLYNLTFNHVILIYTQHLPGLCAFSYLCFANNEHMARTMVHGRTLLWSPLRKSWFRNGLCAFASGPWPRSVPADSRHRLSQAQS
jgi:hypothetical protein